MSKKRSPKNSRKQVSKIPKDAYDRDLHKLQIELVKLQRHFIKCNDKILIILEGRDAAGKDGTIKRIVQHLSPRETRVVALGKPSDRDRASWYFQRYTLHLPMAAELVLFNRSWYSRAGVERVMGFCTEDEFEEFITTVSNFEQMLIKSGITLLKYYLDISRSEQKKRLKERMRDPLTQWKVSPIDLEATKYWKQYSTARDEMLARSHNQIAPWTIVHADNKRAARLNVIRDILKRLHYTGKNKRLVVPDPNIIFAYDASSKVRNQLAK